MITNMVSYSFMNSFNIYWFLAILLYCFGPIFFLFLFGIALHLTDLALYLTDLSLYLTDLDEIS